MKKHWNDKRYPRKCEEFGIPLCMICRQYSTLQLKCTLVLFKERLEQAIDIRAYIAKCVMTQLPKNPIYLMAAIRIYFPEHLDTYNKLAVLL